MLVTTARSTLVLVLVTCQLVSIRAETFQVSFNDELKSCEHPNVLSGSTDSSSPVQRVKLPFTSLNEWQYRYFSAVKQLQDIGNPVCKPENLDSSQIQADVFPINTPLAFDPFTNEELGMIADFVQRQLNLSLSEPDLNYSNSLRADWLYALDMMPTNKAAVLGCLEDGGDQCTGRFARAVVYHLKGARPKIVEYRVGPIKIDKSSWPLTTEHIVQEGEEIDYRMRPVSDGEYQRMEPLVNATMRTLNKLSSESYGQIYDDGSMWWTDAAPRGYNRTTRQTWIWLMWNAEGLYSHCLGLQMLVDHLHLDSSFWTIKQLVYNGQGPFVNASALQAAFDCGYICSDCFPVTRCSVCTYDSAIAAGCRAMSKISIVAPSASTPERPLFSSMRRRGPIRYLDDRPVPPIAPPPKGLRFVVKGHQVHWLGWDLHIGHTILAGIYFSDIRFRNQRIVYELSLQDAWASYSGAQPIQALSVYSDGGWGMGTSSFPLILGVDCPAHAVLMDIDYWKAPEGLATMKNAICIWEQPEDVALMRHYDRSGAYTFASAYARTALIVRTTATVYNYDYIYNYVFHMDGAIEVAAAASGYLQGDFYPTGQIEQDNEDGMGFRVHERTMGNLHDHLFNFKVDLDILGHANSVIRSNLVLRKFKTPWDFGQGNVPFYQEKKQIESFFVPAEGQNSTYKLDPDHPAHFFFTNTDVGRNVHGVHRTYGIHIPGSARQLLSSNEWLPSAQWTANNVVVLRRKDSEPRSCRVLYDMQAPAEPLLEFNSFNDGESLLQNDLVAWVTVGSTHIPSSEDIPITTTPLTRVSFFLRPHNYFDESPATDLVHSVYLAPKSDSVPAEVADSVSTPLRNRCYDGTNATKYLASVFEDDS